jgi:hypothetical protein
MWFVSKLGFTITLHTVIFLVQYVRIPGINCLCETQYVQTHICLGYELQKARGWMTGALHVKALKDSSHPPLVLAMGSYAYKLASARHSCWLKNYVNITPNSLTAHTFNTQFSCLTIVINYQTLYFENHSLFKHLQVFLFWVWLDSK